MESRGFFRSIKNNAAFAKAPTKTIRTQQAHFTASMIAFVKLERLKIRNSKNHYAMKNEIWLAVTKVAWKQWDDFVGSHCRRSGVCPVGAFWRHGSQCALLRPPLYLIRVNKIRKIRVNKIRKTINLYKESDSHIRAKAS